MALFVVFQVCTEMSLSGNYYLLPGDSHHNIRAIQAYNNHSFGLDKSLLFQHTMTIKLLHDLPVALPSSVMGIPREMGTLWHSLSATAMLSETGVRLYQP